jgi:hypothetical protein
MDRNYLDTGKSQSFWKNKNKFFELNQSIIFYFIYSQNTDKPIMPNCKFTIKINYYENLTYFSIKNKVI